MNSIEQLAERVILDAVRNNATDIHFLPRKHDTLIQLRIGNKLIPKFTLPRQECDRLISHFKFTASMDIGERRRPQSGAFTYEVNQQTIGLRLSTLPACNSESLVIRLLPQQQQVPLHQLSLFPSMTKKLIELLKLSNGLIIFTGPTGNGT
ncbi:ATPase, T2SS/T4P/T4SS family [Bacillus marasmi]|uniref:ATPase, T2SS/T4P/T4SS family n=1 Tax=Bacillus marasmi TaxID=1926279 RepID=UPI0011C9C02A|nr:ATPase, T2SS/T4P/T4SS family [Bacillus marasmi]